MIPKSDFLNDIGQLQVAELEHLPITELDNLMRRINAARETVRHYEQILQSALDKRFGDLARQLRQQAGKTTGTVRFTQDGYVVIADLPKKIEYDQKKLKEAVEALRNWGETPEDYVSAEIKVSEAKYNAWPPSVRQLFEPARTLKTGKPSFKLERMQPGSLSDAANDSSFGEVA